MKLSAADEKQLRIIKDAAYTVGTSLDWADHGGGERAWSLIREQPAIVRRARDALSAELRSVLPDDLLEKFERWPEQYWGRVQDAASAHLPTTG